VVVPRLKLPPVLPADSADRFTFALFKTVVADMTVSCPSRVIKFDKTRQIFPPVTQELKLPQAESTGESEEEDEETADALVTIHEVKVFESPDIRFTLMHELVSIPPSQGISTIELIERVTSG
jgi:hypothetical protein